jgi:hypothetical protein
MGPAREGLGMRYLLIAILSLFVSTAPNATTLIFEGFPPDLSARP